MPQNRLENVQGVHPQEISSYSWHFAEHIEIKYTLYFRRTRTRHKTRETLLVKVEVWDLITRVTEIRHRLVQLGMAHTNRLRM